MASAQESNATPQTSTILTWNANGLLARKQELTHFLYSQRVDIALISETHLTSHNGAEICNYCLYTCNHPSGAGQGGAAVYVQSNLLHHKIQPFSTSAIQAAGISAKLHCGTTVNIAAIYSPPRHSIKSEDYERLFKHLGSKWVIGGDFNAKHDFWGSRLCNNKGRELYQTITQHNLTCISACQPTYWPSDPLKRPTALTSSSPVEYPQTTWQSTISKTFLPITRLFF